MEGLYRIYWVIGYDSYYPNDDNYIDSFLTIEEAEEFISKEKELPYHRDHYYVEDVSSRLMC